MADDGIMNRAIALARMWATRPDASSRGRGDKQLLRLLTRPGERDVAILLARGLAGATTAQARAGALEGIDPADHEGLGLLTRSTLALGRTFAPYAPGMVAALASRRSRSSFRGLIIDGDALEDHITATSAQGQRVNVQVLTDPPATAAQARDYVAEVGEFLRRADVDYLSLTPTNLIPPGSPWDVAGAAERIAERLRPLLRIAQESTPHKFINLDVETYDSVAVTTELFEMVLSEEEFMHLSAGLTIQGYLPDSVEALERLVGFATRRVRAGGAPLKVRLVKGGNLEGEHERAQAHGWDSPTYGSRADTDANHLRLIEMALRPEVAYALRLGVATHNLFHVAYAHLLAQERGLTAALDVEMHHTSGPVSLATVQAELDNPIIASTPVLPSAGWDAGISQVTSLLADAGREGAFLSDLARGQLQDQEEAFLAGCTTEAPSRPWRTYATEIPQTGFRATSPSDPSLARAREELLVAVSRDPADDGAAPEALGTTEEVDAALASAVNAQGLWSTAAAQTRDAVLRSIAAELASRRAALVAALCHETGKTITEADAEVSEAIDHAVYCAQGALDLPEQARSDGLEFTPDRVVAVVTPRTSPVAAAIAGTASALAAGSAAIVRASGHTLRSAGLVKEALHAGLAAHEIALDTVNVVLTDEADAGRHLIASREVDSVVLTGSHATAALFTSWRVGHERGARVFAAAQGNNSIIVTPSADSAVATRDILDSAFINAGQACTRAATAILVADQATAESFSTGLVEALKSMTVDWGVRPVAQIGGLAAAATPDQRAALEELLEGEQWLLAPQQLDDAGRLWRPGVRLSPKPPAVDQSVPVLTVVRANTLAEALTMQNADEFGLLGALHSRSVEEINEWLAGVEVGSAYVNRGFRGPTTGYIPLGGWKRSVVGPGAKIGGPEFIGLLGQWHDAASPEHTQEHDLQGQIGPRVTEFLEIVSPWLEAQERDWLEEAARSDGAAREVLRRPVAWAGLSTQVNVVRHRPGPRITLRAGADARLVDVLRVYAAALATGVDAGVSLAPEVFDLLPVAAQEQWHAAQAPAAPPSLEAEPVDDDQPAENGPAAAPEGIPAGTDVTTSPLGWVSGWRVESREQFTTRASTWAAPGRIRCIGTSEVAAVSEAVSTSIAVLCDPVLRAGSRELRAFLREQSVSVWNLPAVSEGKLDFIR